MAGHDTPILRTAHSASPEWRTKKRAWRRRSWFLICTQSYACIHDRCCCCAEATLWPSLVAVAIRLVTSHGAVLDKTLLGLCNRRPCVLTPRCHVTDTCSHERRAVYRWVLAQHFLSASSAPLSVRHTPSTEMAVARTALAELPELGHPVVLGSLPPPPGVSASPPPPPPVFCLQQPLSLSEVAIFPSILSTGVHLMKQRPPPSPPHDSMITDTLLVLMGTFTRLQPMTIGRNS